MENIMIKKNSEKNTMQNLGILYFSSTGNSLYISKKNKRKIRWRNKIYSKL